METRVLIGGIYAASGIIMSTQYLKFNTSMKFFFAAMFPWLWPFAHFQIPMIKLALSTFWLVGKTTEILFAAGFIVVPIWNSWRHGWDFWAFLQAGFWMFVLGGFLAWVFQSVWEKA